MEEYLKRRAESKLIDMQAAAWTRFGCSQIGICARLTKSESALHRKQHKESPRQKNPAAGRPGVVSCCCVTYHPIDQIKVFCPNCALGLCFSFWEEEKSCSENWFNQIDYNSKTACSGSIKCCRPTKMYWCWWNMGVDIFWSILIDIMTK